MNIREGDDFVGSWMKRNSTLPEAHEAASILQAASSDHCDRENFQNSLYTDVPFNIHQESHFIAKLKSMMYSKETTNIQELHYIIFLEQAEFIRDRYF